ncbi:MAG: hypothetical protein IKB39_05485 [Bacteroidaceae bacterium]|nr:hypothetical protein [Bacteroidaceae bacterium]
MKIFLLRMSVLLLVMTAVPFSAFSVIKSDKVRPAWLKKTPQALNNTYSFKVVSVDNGQDLSSSQLLARAELTRYVKREFNIQTSEELESVSNTTMSGGNISDYSENEKYVLRVKSEDETVGIYCEKVDEYYEVYTENGIRVFKLYTLFAVSNVGSNAYFDDFRRTTQYGARGLWRSAICPGWGQMYKGSTAKGLTILAAEVATIGGIIFTENERATYESKMHSQPNFARQYKAKMDNYETARNCCIGVAAAIYVYNLIDAIVAPGARRVVVKPRNLQFTPVAYKDFSGVTFTYNF